MIFLNDKTRAQFQKNPFIGRRFAYEIGDAKEKPQQEAVPEEEKFENRKKQARGEIDAIYESGKYDTYNFRKLPQEFKDHMRNNFGEWIDANIAKYDKDKNSGIDAAEYADFKAKLNEKVTEILDRLIEAKEQKKKEADQTKETAEQAQEAQKRLEGVDTSKLNEANLENEDGCYTELLSYQKDFEKEASGFSAMSGVFSGTKEQVEEANKSHYTGATAFGEMLVSWVEDIPEVKAAKDAKEKAVADFRTKLGEMKKRQKDRQTRGSKLNGAPEKIRGRISTQYDEEKNKTREESEKAKKAAEDNKREKERLDAEIKLNDERRKAAQTEYDKIAIRLQDAERRKAEVQKRTGEMKEAVTGFEATAEAARKEQVKRAGEAGLAGGREDTRNAKTVGAGESGKLSPEELARQAQDAARKAREAAGQLETGLGEADKAVGGMSGSAMVIQRRLADMNGARKLMSSDLSKREKTSTLLDEVVTGFDERLENLDKEEKQRVEQVDALDSAIAETVIQVDTSNFELIKKGEGYLKMLNGMDVSGPGLLDTAGAMIKGIPGVETVYDWSGDKLSAAWQWAKEAPFLKYVIGGAEDMGKDWVKMWGALGDGLSWMGDKMHLGEAWDWMDEASKHLSIGNPTGNAVVDAILDTFSGGGLGTIIEVFSGVTEGAKGLVQGVGMMLQHPFETIKGLGGLLNHPGKIIDALIQQDKWGNESASKIIGRAIFDVVATLSGAGATATSIKTAIAAMKLGGMSAGKAFLLALKTFGKVFVEDIGKVVYGVVKMPVTLTKGLADLAKWVARGGKKSSEAIRLATLERTGMAARETEALRGLEAVRGNPDEFMHWLQKYPDQIDTAYKVVKEERKAARATVKGADNAAVKAEKRTTPPAEIDYGANISSEERTGQHIRAQGLDERQAANELAFQERLAAEKAAEMEMLKGRLRREAEGAEKQKTVVAELSASDRALLARRPDYHAKPLTHDRLSIMRDVEEKITKSEVFVALNKKFGTATEELKKRFIEELKGVDKESQEFKDVSRRHREEMARLDPHRLLEALPEDELDLLRRNFENLDETIMSRVLRQEYMMILDIDNKPVRVYLGNAINNGAFGMVHDSAYVVGREKTIHTVEAIKRPRDMASIKADKEYKDYTTAQMNDHLVAMEVSVANEVRTFEAVRDFKNGDGLLRPRVISNNPANPFVIYDKIESGSEIGVRLKDRIVRGDNAEDIVGFAADSMDGELNLAQNGTGKPSPNAWWHLDIKLENIFVGRDKTGALHGVLGDLSLNNADDIATIRFMEGTLPSGSKQIAVLKVDKTNYTRSVQIGVTPEYFSFDHVNKSFEWVKANPGKAVPEAIMALPGNYAYAVTLEKNFYEFIRDGNGKIISKEFNEGRLPATNSQHIRSEIETLIKRLKDPESGIDITTRQAEFRRLQKMMSEARAQDGQIPSAALRPTG